MNSKVEYLPDYRLAYVRQVGPYGSGNTQAMQMLKKWAYSEKLLDSAIILGIPRDDPQTTLPEECRYDACIVIAEDYRWSEATIKEDELSGGNYVIVKIKHTAEDMERAWNEIFTFTKENRYRIDDKPILERYTTNMVNKQYCEICVPIKPL